MEDYIFKITDEFLVKAYFKEKQPLGLSVIKTEYTIPYTHKRIDILAQDNQGMVVIEIKANYCARLNALNQAIDYKYLIQTIFNTPTRIIILSNRFSQALFNYQSSTLSLYSVRLRRTPATKNWSIDILEPQVKTLRKPIVISPSQLYIPKWQFMPDYQLTLT